jgi:CRP/FNR family transcriptional regulator, cyclic AMP receptor protein
MVEQEPESNSVLLHLTGIGSASALVEVLYSSLGHSKFFEDFTPENINTLAQFMHIYKADPGQVIIKEGDTDDFMLFVLEGLINIVKTDANGDRRSMTYVGPGATLGEMSMIDGEPRFATCIAIDATIIAVFSRDSMVQIIMEEPSLGSKILIKLVTLLSQRLRETSSSLLHYLERSDAV